MTSEPIKGPYRFNSASRAYIYGADGTLISSVHGNSGVDTVRATAALLAASWELREALADVLEMAEAWARGKHITHPDNERCMSARAALAKAEGFQP